MLTRVHFDPGNKVFYRFFKTWLFDHHIDKSGLFDHHIDMTWLFDHHIVMQAMIKISFPAEKTQKNWKHRPRNVLNDIIYHRYKIGFYSHSFSKNFSGSKNDPFPYQIQ